MLPVDRTNPDEIWERRLHDLIFVVRKPPPRPGDGTMIWVFTKHEDALRCRRENKLTSHDMWGCAVDCYKFKDEK